MKNKNSILLTIIIITSTARGVIQTDLEADTRCKVFDTTSGTLYLGLEGGGDNAISSIPRFNGTGKPPISGIATDSSLSGETIEFITLAKSWNQSAQRLAVVVHSGVDFEQIKVNLLTRNGATVTTSTDTTPDGDTSLYDANDPAAQTSGIVNLAASDSHVFAAVRPNGGGDFGNDYSGIALMTINPLTTALTIKNATTGADGNQAKRFDGTSVALKINNDVIFDPGVPNSAARLHWDDKLQRLYIGIAVKAGSDVNNGARSIAVARVETVGTLTIGEFVPDNVFDVNTTDIIGIELADAYIGLNHIRTMHASTGPSYLIISGNVDPAINGLNRIYALPIVDVPSNAAQHGTLARKDSVLTGGKFTVPATTNAHLPTITDAAALVGVDSLATETQVIPSDIVVIGDTVYVSIEKEQTDENESGIFYSQALFDETGKITRWTPWTKRAFPFTAFPDIETAEDKSKVKFFAVDAVNGKLWAINAVNKNQLSCTDWNLGIDTGDTATTLAGKLNSFLSRGCFSALDLDQSTRGLGTSSPARYALFGGLSRVLFARVSQSVAVASPYDANGGIPYTQTVTDDFSDTTNFLMTQLPSVAGSVVALEYSRRLNASANQNYFFAGTQNGLYVFADAGGNGFTIDNTVDDLNATPFDGQWHKMDGITESVLSIKTSGNDGLYILTLETKNNEEHPLISRLYKITPGTTIENMETSIVLLAQSEVTATNSDLSSVKTILGMEIISTAANASTEQLVIATNNGLFRSGTNGLASVTGATNQAEAEWGLVAAGQTKAYYDIFGIDNALVKTTAWPVEIADEKGLLTFEHSIIRQLHGTANGNNFTFVPTSFNAADTDPVFQVVKGTTHFWSDGTRRFFIVRYTEDPGDTNRLMVLPYDTQAWGIVSPYSFLSEPPLNNITSFYWAKQIGVTGIFMVGTRKGIAALQ